MICADAASGTSSATRAATSAVFRDVFVMYVTSRRRIIVRQQQHGISCSRDGGRHDGDSVLPGVRQKRTYSEVFFRSGWLAGSGLVRARCLRAGVDGEGGGVEAAAQQVEADLRVAGAVPQVVMLVGVVFEVEQLADGGGRGTPPACSGGRGSWWRGSWTSRRGRRAPCSGPRSTRSAAASRCSVVAPRNRGSSERPAMWRGTSLPAASSRVGGQVGKLHQGVGSHTGRGSGRASAESVARAPAPR